MQHLTPKLISTLREGYSKSNLLGDLFAGLTVGIIALPLAMAFGIASVPQRVVETQAAAGVPISPPAMGLYASIIAGVVVALFGGSRVQVSGASGISIVIISSIAMRDGYAGLLMATLMAGAILIVMGVARFGAIIKFIPYPVVTGFTAGSAVIIATAQLREFFGLTTPPMDPDFISKIQTIAAWFHTFQWKTLTLGLCVLGLLIAQRRFAPKLPGLLIAVVLAALANSVLHLGAETIQSKFGGIPRSLPVPQVPDFDWQLIKDLVPDATIIAMVVAIEALLSAVVADGMTGRRHRSDAELVGQGLANMASALFGALPVTGGASRTVANIKAGAQTPMSSIIHAFVLIAIILLLAPLAGHIPLCALAAILFMVAWNMVDFDQFRSLLRAPGQDVAVLLTTLGLTVFVSFTIAVGVGLVLASLLFMKRMADVSNISAVTREFADQDSEADDLIADLKDPDSISKSDVPPGVEVYEIDGPFFFGVADRLKDILNQVERPPKVFILRMRRVPAMDATGIHALEEFHQKCKRQGVRLMLSGVHAQPLFAVTQAGLDQTIGLENMFETLADALQAARAVA